MNRLITALLMLATAPAFAQSAETLDQELELASFFAESAGPAGIRLHWTTMTERANEFFVVQRSQNGMSWETATGTAGIGKAEPTTYTLTDAHPFAEVSYYRLLSVWNGEQTELSDEFAVLYQPTPQLNIHSEPQPGRFMVTADGTITDLKVLNDRGQFIPMRLDVGTDEIMVNLELLIPGNYFVQALVNGSPVLRPVTLTSTGIIGG